jgi:hypothetical protein
MTASRVLWRDSIVLSRDAARIGRRGDVHRARRARDLVRVGVGASMPAEVWNALDADGRFLARIAAEISRVPKDAPVTHLSSAALWGLPMIDPWPERVETSIAADSVLRSRRGMIRHRVGRAQAATEIAGIPVSSLAQTVVDVAATQPFAVAVAMTDAALAGRIAPVATVSTRLLPEQLDAAVQGLQDPRARRRAARVVAFADAASGSPGESLSRSAIHELGLPAPELQHVFRDDDGLIGIVDFWWPRHSLVGEFDGVAKYVRTEYTDGRSVHEVVLAEKRRESRLRDITAGVVRWGWQDARSPRALEFLLRPRLKTSGSRS